MEGLLGPCPPAGLGCRGPLAPIQARVLGATAEAVPVRVQGKRSGEGASSF